MAVFAVQQAFEAKARTSFGPASTDASAAEGASHEVNEANADHGAASPRAIPPASLPTTLGLPPPPELASFIAASTAPRAPTDATSFEDDALPVTPSFWALLRDDLRGLREKRLPENKTRLVAASVVVLAASIGVLGLLVHAIGGDSEERSDDRPSEPPRASSTPPASSDPPSPRASAPEAVASAEAPKVAPPAEPPPSTCVVAGSAQLVASNAYAQSGVELAATNRTIALGFAVDAHDGMTALFDASTFSAGSKTRVRGSRHAEAQRVVPSFSKDKVTAIVDVDRRGDKLSFRRVVPTDPPIDLGIEGNAIAFAAHGHRRATKLFSLEGAGAVEPVLGVPSDGGVAIAFRRGSAIYVGFAKGSPTALRPSGRLAEARGRGQVGVPAMAVVNGSVVVAWSDRDGADDPWQLRWATFDMSSSKLSDVASLAVPSGGPGVQAMSPSLAALDGDRLLFAWTEGPASRQHVRASVMTKTGAFIGAPMDISSSGSNAGRSRVVVGPTGRGAIAFFEAANKGFDLRAVPLACSLTNAL